MKQPQRLPLLMNLVSSGLSMTVVGLLSMAIPWLMISSGAGTAWAGVAAFALQLPVAAGFALGGFFSDAYGPKRVLMGSGIGAVVCIGAATLLAHSSTAALPVLVGVLALSNLIGAAGDVAQESRTPELARLARWPLSRANSASEIVQNGGMMVGAGIAVLLVDRIGLPLTLVWTVVASLLTIAIDAVFFPSFRASRRQQQTGEISALSMLKSDSVLLAIIAIGILLIGAFTSIDEILVPALAVQAGAGGDGVAIYLALAVSSSTVSALFYAWRGHGAAQKRWLLCSVWLVVAGFAILAATPPSLALHLAPVVLGLGAGPLAPILTTLVQRRTPKAFRGAVLGTMGGSIVIVQPFAALMSGPAAQWLGVSTTLWMVAAAVIAGAALLGYGLGSREI
jgi:macrolide resistance protein